MLLLLTPNKTIISLLKSCDRYYEKELIEWWRKNAIKRYNKVKSEGRLRHDLEIWTRDSNIDIIR